MQNFKLTIEYNGTNFEGWQIQPKGSRTVQGEIEQALKNLFQKAIRITGAGRTDSGVHAFGQVANFKIKTNKPLQEIQGALNAHLPDDVSIIKIEEVELEFHSQYDAKWKVYRYQILNRKERSPHCQNKALHLPSKLNLRLMKEEAQSLIGTHDFRSFQGTNRSNKDKENTTRQISRVDIKRKSDLILIEVEGNGFLYKMVRNIVGTLIEIGTQKLPKGSIEKILKQKSRLAASDTAKPHGLSLASITYLK